MKTKIIREYWHNTNILKNEISVDDNNVKNGIQKSWYRHKSIDTIYYAKDGLPHGICQWFFNDKTRYVIKHIIENQNHGPITKFKYGN